MVISEPRIHSPLFIVHVIGGLTQVLMFMFCVDVYLFSSFRSRVLAPC